MIVTPFESRHTFDFSQHNDMACTKAHSGQSHYVTSGLIVYLDPQSFRIELPYRI